MCVCVCAILSHTTKFTHTNKRWYRHTHRSPSKDSSGIQANNWSFCCVCRPMCVCLYVHILRCDCSNLMDKIELQCPKSNSLRLIHSHHKHAHAIREPIWDSKLKRLNHSSSLTTNKHNNTLWYPWLFRYTGTCCTHTYMKHGIFHLFISNMHAEKSSYKQQDVNEQCGLAVCVAIIMSTAG